MSGRRQADRILGYLFQVKQGLTRAEINRITRRERFEIPIQTLCRRLRELEEAELITSVTERECSVTHHKNRVYQLTGHARSFINKEVKKAS